jgi:hypothetical protein
MSDTMFINSTLHPGDELRSANGTFALRFQLDGNLVLYVDSQSSWATQGAGAPGDAAGTHMNRAIWTANTYGPKPTNHRCLMQGDGNLVIYGGPQQKALWASQSQNKGGSRLVVQDDGNVVIYTKDFRPIYDTKTSVALSSGVNTSAPDSPTAPPPHKTDVLPYSPTSGAVAIFELKFGDELRSANGTFALKFQPDGNLAKNI